MHTKHDRFPPVILTGMHRSGTSLVASFLHKSGVDMGEGNLCGAGKGNEKGHFESIPFIEFHQRIMSRKGFDARRANHEAILTEDDLDNAKRIIAQRIEEAGGGPWGWKDPRTSLFLPFWGSLLPEAKYLFMVRNPFAVADSLHRRDDKPGETWWKSTTNRLKTWRIYTKHCLDFAQNNPDRSAVFLLDQIIADPVSFTSRLIRLTELRLEAELFKQLYDPKILKKKAPFEFVMPMELLKSMRLYRRAKRMSHR
jgi:hypothetical protein